MRKYLDGEVVLERECREEEKTKDVLSSITATCCFDELIMHGSFSTSVHTLPQSIPLVSQPSSYLTQHENAPD